MDPIEGVPRYQGELVSALFTRLPVLGVLEGILVPRQRLSRFDEHVLVLVELDPAALDKARRFRQRRGEGWRRKGFLVMDLFVEHELTLVGRGKVYPHRTFLEHRDCDVLHRRPPVLSIRAAASSEALWASSLASL